MTYQTSKYFVATLDLLVPVGIIIFSLSILYFLFFSPFFAVKNITCMQDVGQTCENEFLLAEVAGFKGKNLFLLSTGEITQHLLSGDKTIRSITIGKTLPGNLSLTVQSAHPRLALTTAAVDKIFLLDDSYRVIQTTPTDPHVPVVVFDQPLSLRVGQSIEDPSLTKLLNYSLEIAQKIPGTTKLIIQGHDLQIKLSSGILAIFTSDSDISPQISALQAVVGTSTITDGVTQIDVRYAQPVLRHN